MKLWLAITFGLALWAGMLLYVGIKLVIWLGTGMLILILAGLSGLAWAKLIQWFLFGEKEES